MWNMHRNATLRVRPLNGPTFGKQVQVQRWQHDLRTGRWLRVSIAVMQESERELFAELDVLSRWSLKWSDWHDRASNRHCIWTSRYLTCPIGLEIDLKGRSRSWFRGYDWRYILWKQRLGPVISSIFFVLVLRNCCYVMVAAWSRVCQSAQLRCVVRSPRRATYAAHAALTPRPAIMLPALAAIGGNSLADCAPRLFTTA